MLSIYYVNMVYSMNSQGLSMEIKREVNWYGKPLVQLQYVLKR